jgi:hypothetical protein
MGIVLDGRPVGGIYPAILSLLHQNCGVREQAHVTYVVPMCVRYCNTSDGAVFAREGAHRQRLLKLCNTPQFFHIGHQGKTHFVLAVSRRRFVHDHSPHMWLFAVSKLP